MRLPPNRVVWSNPALALQGKTLVASISFVEPECDRYSSFVPKGWVSQTCVIAEIRPIFYRQKCVVYLGVNRASPHIASFCFWYTNPRRRLRSDIRSAIRLRMRPAICGNRKLVDFSDMKCQLPS